jgi:hypothetical protein
METIRTYQEEARSVRLFEIEGRRYHAINWIDALNQYEGETGTRPPRQAVVEIVG